MYQINFEAPVKVHFIGIGGISMSGLAEILLSRGFPVSGSDNRASALTEALKEKGAVIQIGQRAGNITDDIGLVVYTAAIHADNPERAEAERRGLPMLTRAELLGQIMKNYPDSVAVAGTHGKTTTTSMLTSILLSAELDPTISVGGILKEIGGNIRIGRSGYFVTEACEYTNSFLSFFPKIDIILNIEEDHLDFFKDLDDIRHSFREFACLVPDDGSIIINAGITDYQEICKGAAGNIITFSDDPEKQADYSCFDITYDEHGCGSYVLLIRGKEAGRITLSVPGRHNVLNSLAAIAAAKTLGVSDDSISAGLKRFTGTDRRFEYKGSIGGVTVIDDYAHHPTEIRATLAAAENYPHNRLWCVFQPHTYSRTKSLFSEFVDALSLADHVILADIYAAREQDTLGMSSQLLMEEINRKTGDDRARYFNSFDRIEAFLLAECTEGDLILTMGAGDIYKVGETILGKN
ncbi:MAG: UDP-N-acetylmuramate--L-alanine ligase [Lachnospiraceae bacterium]|nr:UDP-N-acetylmuramate--L-alanine ligase [Lachnospiraceae bacterium]